MTLKVTLIVDPEHGGELIALLAKAYSRNELGLGDIRIERAKAIDVGLKAVHQAAAAITKVIEKPKLKRKSNRAPGLGERAFKTGKVNGTILILTGLSHDASRDGLMAMWTAKGFNPNGLSASLTKLSQRGYLTMLGEGRYRLTPRGADVVNRWEDRNDEGRQSGE